MGYLSVNGLGDSMPLGPQVQLPPRVGAAQIIMRGPHGAPLAPPPVRTKRGIQWWHETTPLKGERWKPQQRVVGLMGVVDNLWDTAVDVATFGPLRRAVAGEPVVPRQPIDTPQRFDSSKHQTEGATPVETKRALTKLVGDLETTARNGQKANGQPVTTEWVRAGQAQLRDAIMRAGRWTDVGPGYDAQPSLLARLSRIQIRAIREERPGAISPTAANRDGSDRLEDPDAVYWRTLRREVDPRGGPMGDRITSLLWQGAIVVAGGLVLYGAARGLGEALGSRVASRGSEE